MSEPTPTPTPLTIDATAVGETVERTLAELTVERAGEAIVIPLAGLPAGTQIAISIVIGPSEPAPAPEPAPAGPVRRYATGGR